MDTEHNGPIRVLAVDDHATFRQGIALLVGSESDMQVVAEATNGREAVEQFRKHRPDITLMDLQMDKMCGADALTAIRGEFPEARIMVLTTYPGDVRVVRAFHAGEKRIPPEIAAQIAKDADKDS